MAFLKRFELPKDIQSAELIQYRLAQQLILEDKFKDEDEIRLVAGGDVAYEKDGQRLVAAVVVFDLKSFTVVEQVVCAGRVKFPYVPGFLSFREGPVLLAAIRKLKTEPDVFLFDGQGIAHPRRLGIASHLGVLLDRPAIGCAKSHLFGSYEEPGKEKGAFSFIRDRFGDAVGLVLRTKANTRPVFVSPGHRVSVAMAGRIVLRCVSRYRLSEPLRQAHIIARRAVMEPAD
ncbi:MAG: deoxyribonuclease V [candidate division WOR-3 bacterium]|uniref:Endonuclease V n=1 Tax=candidate division WOR-3 bacterium TaxID=2052148 RepID=A0A7C3EHH7_UNCW3|nr:deoxyribonuclease V [candidate division WOR-3 bacterium]